jgi:hypothetical protein
MRIKIVARTWALVSALALLGSPAAWADDFVISLQISQGDQTTESKLTRQHPTTGEQPPRLVFKGVLGKPLRVTWKVTNASGATTYRDVLVHFLLAPEKEAGQLEAPPLGKDDIEHEGAVTLDFKPGDQAMGEFTTTFDKDGVYLLRVETIGVKDAAGHEYHAAVDVELN